MLRLGAALLGVLALETASVQADTPAWCNAAGLAPAERTICQNPRLGDLDTALNAAWRATRGLSSRGSQDEWLEKRNRCGNDETCISEAYESRLAELSWQAAQDGDGRPSQELQRALDHLWSDEQHREDDPAAIPIPPDLPPETLSQLAAMMPRPWCNASVLNPTERRICEDPMLSRLDALLALSYGQDRAARDDEAQAEWLRAERDACGTDRACIALAYSVRLHEFGGD